MSNPTAAKRDRHQAILAIIGAHAVGSQEELRRHLHDRGWDVTQSTLSRDLHELRLARVPTGVGMRYVATDGATGAPVHAPADGAGQAGHAQAGHAQAVLAALLPQLFDRVDGVGELAVVHTVPSGAQPIAAALDAARWPDVLGTIGGDDTILIVCRSPAARAEVGDRLQALARGEPRGGARGGARNDAQRSAPPRNVPA